LLLVTGVYADSPRYAFGVNGLDFSLSTYRVEANGELSHLGHRPLDKSPPQVAIHPSGHFVLALSKTASTIAVFRLDRAHGDLTPVPGSPFRAEANSPFGLAFHPSGRFVYVAARFSGVAAYAFDLQSGALTALPGSPFPAQERTRAVIVHPSGRFLYVSNGYSNSISAYQINQNTGVLSELPGSPYSVGNMSDSDFHKTLAVQTADAPPEAGGIPYDIALSPTGHFVYVANWMAANISAFRVNTENGALTTLDGSPFETGFNPYRLSVHPSGHFVFVALVASNKIAVHALDPDSGRLTSVPNSPFLSGGDGPVALTFTADGRQVYVTHNISNDMALLDVDTMTGAVKLRQILKTRTGPWFFALADGEAAPQQPIKSEETKEHIYMASSQAGTGLARFVDGRLSRKGLVVGSGESIATHPQGRFVYVLNHAEGILSSFRIRSTDGTLEPMPGGVVSAGKSPTDLAIDINGWYLYVTDDATSRLLVFYLDPDSGLPKAVSGPRLLSGQRPVSITLDPAARYAYVVNAGSNDISVYRYMNSVTPLIFESRKSGSPFAAGQRPVALAVEPTGRFVYTANADSNDISAYRVHHQTGALSQLPGSPFKTGRRPMAVVAHPNGQWLFVANHDSTEVFIYRIETALGALKAVDPVDLPVQPEALWLNPMGNTAYVSAEGGTRLLTFSVDGRSGLFSPLSDQQLAEPLSDMAFIQ
jgi:6-phosphogluconolactonase (cycloisomerase 2 family)